MRGFWSIKTDDLRKILGAEDNMAGIKQISIAKDILLYYALYEISNNIMLFERLETLRRIETKNKLQGEKKG